MVKVYLDRKNYIESGLLSQQMEFKQVDYLMTSAHLTR